MKIVPISTNILNMKCANTYLQFLQGSHGKLYNHSPFLQTQFKFCSNFCAHLLEEQASQRLGYSLTSLFFVSRFIVLVGKNGRVLKFDTKSTRKKFEGLGITFLVWQKSEQDTLRMYKLTDRTSVGM